MFNSETCFVEDFYSGSNPLEVNKHSVINAMLMYRMLCALCSKLTIKTPLVAAVENFNFSSANPTKWSSTVKQFVGDLATNCLSVFDHFMGLTHKGLTYSEICGC